MSRGSSKYPEGHTGGGDGLGGAGGDGGDGGEGGGVYGAGGGDGDSIFMHVCHKWTCTPPNPPSAAYILHEL